MQILGLFSFFRGIYLYNVPVFFKVFLAIIIEFGVFNLTLMLLFCKQFPTWLCIVLGFTGISLIYLSVATVIMELLRICKYNSEKIYLFLASLSIILAIIAFSRSLSQPNISKIVITSNKLKKDCKIVQLSDLHVGPVLKHSWVEKVVEKVNEINPDIIVITGDSVDSFTQFGLDYLKPFNKFRSPVYMIMGNHEYYCGAHEWIKEFQKMGIKILINSHEIINDNFVLGGADWMYISKIKSVNLNKDKNSKGAPINNYVHNSENLVAKTFYGAPPNMPKILLSHYPKSFIEAKKEDVLLQLSGHTHGGQSFPANLFVSLANGGYLRGLYKELNSKGEYSYLYVNDGTGLWAGMPARLGSSNEITIIELKKQIR